MSDQGAARDVVFVSYSREDADWRRRFVQMLSPAVEERVDVWSDERNVVGQEWEPQLEDAIARTALGLLLVTPDFLTSRYIMDTELTALEGRGVPLVCVLVRPCLWKHVPRVSRLQWAHDPGRDGALSSADDPEGQIVRVCERLVELLAETGVQEQPRVVAPGRRDLTTKALVRAQSLGDLHGVPPLPPGFVDRHEVDTLRTALLGSDSATMGITGNARDLGLHGQGGIGKTVLATALARDEEVRRRFPDGVFWVTLGEDADVVRAQLDLLDELGAPHRELRLATQGLELLRESLADRGALLIVDDVWSVAAATAFQAAGPHGRVLYTTRDAAILQRVGAQVEAVDVLSPEVARRLLARLSGVDPERLPVAAEQVLDATGRVALGLALIGAAVGKGNRTWDDVTRDLAQGKSTFLEHPYANTFKAMKVAMAALPDALAAAYRALAVYPHDTTVPVAAVARYWAHLTGSSGEDTGDRLRELASRELLTMDDDGFAFHDLQRDFLLLHTEHLSLLHGDLLGAYRTLLPPEGSWSELDPEEPYIWEHLMFHLDGAGDGAGMRALATNLGYVAVRVFRSGPYAAEADLEAVASLYPGDEAVAWLSRFLGRRSYLLTRCKSVGDLAATMLSLGEDAPPTIEISSATPALPARYLAHVWGDDREPPALVRVLEGHMGRLTSVAFSPDGLRLASGGGDGTIKLWDARSGRVLATLRASEAQVNSVCFSPDGALLATGADDGTTQVWDLSAAAVRATFSGSAGVKGVAFAPDGRRLAAGQDDGAVAIVDIETGESNTIVEPPAPAVLAVAFSPDGRRLAGSGETGALWLHDMKLGTRSSLLGHQDQVNDVAFSPDGRHLASAANDTTVRVWLVAERRPLLALDHGTFVHCVAFSPDGRHVAAGTLYEKVRLWDVGDGRAVGELLDHTSYITAVAYSPDGARLASTSLDGTVRLWDPNVALVPTDAKTSGAVWAVAASPDGRYVANVDDEGIVLRDGQTGRTLGALALGTDIVWALAFAPDSSLLAGAITDGLIRAWRVPSLEEAFVLEADEDAEGDELVWSSDARRLAIRSRVRVRLWDAAARRLIATLPIGEEGGATGIALSPDGRYLGIGTYGTVVIADADSGTSVKTLRVPTGNRQPVAFAGDSRRLACGGDDEAVWIWDIRSENDVLRLHHDTIINTLTFSPDGDLLVGVSYDDTLLLWDARDGSLLSRLQVATDLRSIAWGPRGVTVGQQDRVVQLRVAER